MEYVQNDVFFEVCSWFLVLCNCKALKTRTHEPNLCTGTQYRELSMYRD